MEGDFNALLRPYEPRSDGEASDGFRGIENTGEGIAMAGDG
jgi:hypothetical protein